MKAYKEYTVDSECFTESFDLTNAIDSVKLSIKGATLAFDLVQDNVDTEFKVYALIMTMNQITNMTIEGTKRTRQEDEKDG